MKCSTDLPDLELKYKRTTVSGNNVYVDFVMTYYGKDEMEIKVYNGSRTIFYDDEGNIYRGIGVADSVNSKITADVGNADSSYGALPSGIPVKLRMLIKGVDEFATSFPKVTIAFYSNGEHEMHISNVPIPRD